MRTAQARKLGRTTFVDDFLAGQLLVLTALAFEIATEQFPHTRVHDRIRIVQVERLLVLFRMLVLMMVAMVMMPMVVTVVMMARAQGLVFAVLQLVRRIQKETSVRRYAGPGQRRQVHLFARVQEERLLVALAIFRLPLPAYGRLRFGDRRVAGRAARVLAIAIG